MALKALKKKKAQKAAEEAGTGKLLASFIDKEGIKKLIPHREPMLLIDELRDVIDGESAIGVKHLKEDDHFFQGHFPSRPVMPGVMIVEALAQTAAAFVVKMLDKEGEENLVYFMSIENARFRKPVLPGQKLELLVRKIKNKRNVWKFSGEAYVDDTLVSQATFSAMMVDE